MSKTIAGGLIGRALGAYRKKPVIPDLPPLVLGDIQKETTAGNLAALPGEMRVGAAVDQYNFDQLRKAVEFWSPGALGQLQETLGAQLRGEFDASGVIRSATAAGYGKGFGPSFRSQFGIGRTMVAKNLGLESMDVQQRGLTNLMNLYQIGPRAYNPTANFVNTQFAAQFARANRAEKFQRDLLANQVAAAPNPADVALAEGFDNFFAFWAGVGGGAIGSLMPGGGGGGPLTTKGNPGIGQSAGQSFYVPNPSGSRYEGSDWGAGSFI